MPMSLNMTKFGHFFIRKFSSIKDFYTKNHEWLKIIQNDDHKALEKPLLRARIGITDYSQKALGDIVFIDMPKVETKYSAQGNILFLR